MDKDKLRAALSQLKHEDEAYHERIIEMLTHEYDDYSSSCEEMLRIEKIQTKTHLINC